MLNFFIGFAFFELGVMSGFFVAALMRAARAGEEIAGRNRAENRQPDDLDYQTDRPNPPQRRKKLGGDDSYQNLIIVSDAVHVLIHSFE